MNQVGFELWLDLVSLGQACPYPSKTSFRSFKVLHQQTIPGVCGRQLLRLSINCNREIVKLCTLDKQEMPTCSAPIINTRVVFSDQILDSDEICLHCNKKYQSNDINDLVNYQLDIHTFYPLELIITTFIRSSILVHCPVIFSKKVKKGKLHCSIVHRKCKTF